MKKLKRYKSTDYIFASSFIQSRGKYMLTKGKIEKMLAGKSAGDALNVLYELNYGEGSLKVSDREYETLLSLELKKTYDLVTSLAPEPEYFKIFLYQNDYHNLKTLLKAEFLGISANEYLTDAGNIPLAQLAGLVQNRNYSGMSEEMAKGIREVLDVYGTTGDSQVIDLILDKACYKDMNINVSKLKNDFIKGYISLKIDVINLKSFVRIKAMNKSPDFFSRVFIEGGKVPKKLFISDFDEELEYFAEELMMYGLGSLMHEGAFMIEETGGFSILEKLCDNMLMDYIRDAKYISYGIQPLVSFVLAKENEIKIARIIIAGKLAGVKTEQIRERVRDTYA